jgi:hypothetical protein
MNRTCHKQDCDEPLGENDYAFCNFHRQEINAEMKEKEDERILARSKDPFYFQDLTIFSKAIEIVQPREEEFEDMDDDDNMYWVVGILYTLLFDIYYKKEQTKLYGLMSDMNIKGDESRTQLLVELIRAIKEKCYQSMGTVEEIKDRLHAYQCCVNFLTRWIEEQKLIDKNLLTKELDLVNDVTKKLVETIVTKL